jgi:hypothetical protein
MTNPHIGSTFESFLEEQGLKEEVDLLAQKRVIALADRAGDGGRRR